MIALGSWCGDQEAPGVVVAVLDTEVDGQWLRVVATLASPDPDAGLAWVHPLDITASDEDGQIIPLATAEVASLRAQLERAYYRWRDRGVHKGR